MGFVVFHLNTLCMCVYFSLYHTAPWVLYSSASLAETECVPLGIGYNWQHESL